MRTVFFISNRTAITAETLGHGLLAQFEGLKFNEVTMPYIDSTEKAREVVARINKTADQATVQPIVFSTLADPAIREMIVTSQALVLDLFESFLPPMETELQIKPLQRTGLSHRIVNLERYESRIDAINFTLLHDDGAYTRHYEQSDVILIGVSRSGKTPTCLYLALQFGLRAANYPTTEEDLQYETLPKPLQSSTSKLYGLTTEPERLHKIRTERRPGSRYASLPQCRHEVRAAENLFLSHNIPYLNTTTRSVEEISTEIVQNRGLDRHGY